MKHMAWIFLALAVLGCAMQGGSGDADTPVPTITLTSIAAMPTVTTVPTTITQTAAPTLTATAVEPSATPTLLPASTPVRVTFGGGGTSATVSGTVPPSGNVHYVLRVIVDQTMNLTLTTSSGEAVLGVSAPLTGVMLSPDLGQTTFSQQLPNTDDYDIEIRWRSGGTVSYTLVIDIPPLPGTAICWMTTHEDLTAYFDPRTSADVFGQTGVDLVVAAQARTSDGWIGFDPGVAQAGNTGLDRLRWILPGSVSFDPAGCDTRLQVVVD